MQLFSETLGVATATNDDQSASTAALPQPVDENPSVVSESGKPNIVSYFLFCFVLLCVFFVGAVFLLFCACERGCCVYCVVLSTVLPVFCVYY